MTIIFTTLDGKRVETQNVDRLFEAAREGKIAPTTVIEVDGKRVLAGKIKKLFPPGTPVPAGDPPAVPLPEPATTGDEPPKSVKMAISFLFALIYINAICGIAYGLFVGSAIPAIGIGVIIGTIFGSAVGFAHLHILEYIATKISK